MFNTENLEMMADKAKKNLQSQINNESVVEETNGAEDIYAEFRNGSSVVDSDTNYEEPVIQNESDDNGYGYNDIYDSPAESYYNEYPEYDITPDSSEKLFVGGPTKSHLDSWKKQWAGYGIFVAEVGDDKFIFRTLNRFEYKQIVALQNMDALQREEIICETVTLWPPQFTWDTMATGKAGVPSTYAEIIMAKSGFNKEYSIQVL